MKTRILREGQKLRQTYRTRGLTEVLHQLARDVLATLYQHETQYIFVRKIAAQPTLSARAEAAERRGTTCRFVESLEALQEVEAEIPASIRDSVAQLQQRVEQGCMVILARRPKLSGRGQEVIGYGIYEPGIFSALGRRGKVSSAVLFNHYLEILPEYRGQGVVDLMASAGYTYCLAHGFTQYWTVISPANQPAIRETQRNGFTCTGVVARVSILRGLVIWETPWERIEDALRLGEPRRNQ